MRFNPIPILALALVLLVFGLVPAHASPPFDDGTETAFVFDAPNDDGTSTPTVLVNPPPIQVSAVAASPFGGLPPVPGVGWKSPVFVAAPYLTLTSATAKEDSGFNHRRKEPPLPKTNEASRNLRKPSASHPTYPRQ